MRAETMLPVPLSIMRSKAQSCPSFYFLCMWRYWESACMANSINETTRVKGINIKNLFYISTLSSVNGPPCILLFSKINSWRKTLFPICESTTISRVLVLPSKIECWGSVFDRVSDRWFCHKPALTYNNAG